MFVHIVGKKFEGLVGARGWVSYSNMITCQMILDNVDESAQAMADII